MIVCTPAEVTAAFNHVPARARRSIFARPTWPYWLTLVVAICGVHVLSPNGVLGNITYILVTSGSAAAAWIGVSRQPRQRRFAWGSIAAGVTCSAAGDAIYYVQGQVTGALSNVSVADGFWLASYVGLAIGLSSLIVGRRGTGRVDIDGLIDIGSFAVMAVLVVTQFGVVRHLVSDSSYSITTRTIWTAYPVFDAAVLGVVVQAMVSRRLRGSGGLFLSCGIALWLTSDFTSLFLVDTSGIHKWLDVGWMVGAVSLGVSTWPPDTRAAPPDNAAATPVTNGRVAITLLPLLVPGLIDIWHFTNGRDSTPIPLFGATLTLVSLALLRSTRLVKARNRQQAKLEHSRRFYAALAENSSDAVIVLDRAGMILNDAPNLATMLGQPGLSTIGVDVISLLRLPDREAARDVLTRWWSTTGVVADAEVAATQADGTERWFGVRAANLAADPDVAGMVINLRDITDRKRAERALDHSGFHDSLTGLANRALFHDRLDHALDRTARTGLGVAIVYLDLDGFKTINDSRGHEAGDRVLREVAARIASAVRTLDTVSRLGGDEFAILIEESGRVLDEAETVAERVLQSLTSPFIVDGHQIVLSASIGIAMGDVSCTASSMMRDADVAMYKAKMSGKARWAVYEPAMRTAALDKLELESDLHQAVDEGQLRLVYQPVIELRSSKIVGFEALLRWDHPTRGRIEPTTFIPIAENNGTMVSIGRWVLDEACRTAAQWNARFPSRKLTMAVNLSARQLAAPDIVSDTAHALARSGFPASLLVLEMTESVLVQDADTATRRLHALRKLGVRLAIDDFGTGYSSLSYLRQFPIDILKIDKSFTDTITQRAHIPPIVHGLLELAKTLEMTTVAEGIESEVQRDSLRDQECNFGQGFLFSRPIEESEALALLANGHAIESTPVGL
jgi:diguanylate cyclase (GGDEF)-like protein/PAS domain S-box-containing protein